MLTSIAVILFCVPIVLCWRRCQRESESFGKAAWTVRVQPAAADGSGEEIERDRFTDPKHSYFAEKRKRARVALERQIKRRKLRGTHHGCQINAQPWGAAARQRGPTGRGSASHAHAVDPHIPFKENAGRSLRAFSGRHGHRPRTPDEPDSDDELEAYFRRVS